MGKRSGQSASLRGAKINEMRGQISAYKSAASVLLIHLSKRLCHQRVGEALQVNCPHSIRFTLSVTEGICSSSTVRVF